MWHQTRNGQMAETHRNLAPVLDADRTTGLGVMGLANLVGYRFADVTASGRARDTPGNAGCEPARAVGCVSPVNRRFKGRADVWGGAPRDVAPLQGCSASCDPARLLFAASDTVRDYEHSNGPILAGSYQN